MKKFALMAVLFLTFGLFFAIPTTKVYAVVSISNTECDQANDNCGKGNESNAVPEPATYALLALGLAGIAAFKFRGKFA